MSGTVAPARDGKLLAMVGARPDDLARARPVLDLLCRRVVHAGAVGQGALLKLVVNLPLAVYWQSLAEALALGRAGGLDYRAMLETLQDSSAALAVLGLKTPAILGEPGAVAFDVASMQKDLLYMIETGSASGVPMPATAAALGTYAAASCRRPRRRGCRRHRPFPRRTHDPEHATMNQTTSEIRDGMRIDWDVPITMDDGLVLRADVFRPLGDGRHPALLTYGPYAKGLAFQEGYPSAWQRMAAEHPDVTAGSSNKYQNWEVVDPEKWVPHGYACVRVDSRGCGRSPGYVQHFAPRETRDFELCIEWAATQGWSSGKVGLNGVSYFGINQWQVASRQPQHLAAICVWEGAADWYRDMTHHGGILSTFWANWYDMQVKTVQHGLGTRGPRSAVTGELVCGPPTLDEATLAQNRCEFGEEIRAQPLDGPYYRERSPDWSKVTVPMLTAANWGGQGLHPRGNFEGYMRAASTQKWLEAHGLEHWTEFYTDYGVQLQRRFFDHFLHGVDNGWEREPRVRLKVRHLDRFVERTESDWPIPRTRWTPLHLDGGALALREAAPAGGATISFDATGRRPHVHDRAAAAGDRADGPGGGEALGVLVDDRRGPVRRAARVRARRRGGDVHGRDRPAHADRTGLAARLAPPARSGADAPVAAVSHPRPRSSR